MNSQENREKARAFQRRAEPQPPKKFFPLSGGLLIPVCFLLASLTPGCSLFLKRGYPTFLAPPPALVSSVSGYLSFRLEKDEGLARGRAFFILVPGKGRIEVIDPLGRQAIVAIWDAGEEWLVIPAERVYWHGGQTPQELINTLIGFSLEPVELLGWLIGRPEKLEFFLTEEKSIPTGKKEGKDEWGVTQLKSTWISESGFFPGWEVEKDNKGRLWRGRKGDLTITVEERAQGEVARSVSFVTASASGRMTVLGIEFNRAIPEDRFQPEFIEKRGYRLVTREELEALLKRK